MKIKFFLPNCKSDMPLVTCWSPKIPSTVPLIRLKSYQMLRNLVLVSCC